MFFSLLHVCFWSINMCTCLCSSALPWSSDRSVSAHPYVTHKATTTDTNPWGLYINCINFYLNVLGKPNTDSVLKTSQHHRHKFDIFFKNKGLNLTLTIKFLMNTFTDVGTKRGPAKMLRDGWISRADTSFYVFGRRSFNPQEFKSALQP